MQINGISIIGSSVPALDLELCAKAFIVLAGGAAVAFAFTIHQTYSAIILYSSSVTAGNAYTVCTGGAASEYNLYHGLYLGLLSYPGGTAGTSLTAASRPPQSVETIFKQY